MFMPQIKMIPIFSLIFFSILNNKDSSGLLVVRYFNIALDPFDYHGSLACHFNVNSRDSFEALMDEFNLTDIWRSEHLNLKKYTRHQKHYVVLSRLSNIFASYGLFNNVKSSIIISGISFDHSIVTANISYTKKWYPSQRKRVLETQLSLFET